MNQKRNNRVVAARKTPVASAARKSAPRVSLRKVEQQLSPLLQRALLAARAEFRAELERNGGLLGAVTRQTEAVMLKLQDIDHIRAGLASLGDVAMLREHLAIATAHTRRLLAEKETLEQSVRDLLRKQRDDYTDLRAERAAAQDIRRERDELARAILNLPYVTTHAMPADPDRMWGWATDFRAHAKRLVELRAMAGAPAPGRIMSEAESEQHIALLRGSPSLSDPYANRGAEMLDSPGMPPL
jgi:hypothetical protein